MMVKNMSSAYIEIEMKNILTLKIMNLICILLGLSLLLLLMNKKI